MVIAGYDEWLWRQADEYMSRNEECELCGEIECECYEDNDDIEYEEYKDRMLGL